MNITSNNASILNAENFRTESILNRKNAQKSLSNLEENDGGADFIPRLVSENKEKLVDKFLNASFGNRMKRSPGSPVEANPSNPSSIDREEVLYRYGHMIQMPAFERTQPTCLRLANGGPNPTAPAGYENWEAFLASDGNNNKIKNPKQELKNLLEGTTINYAFVELLRTDYLYTQYYNEFKRSINLAATRENAKSVLDDFKNNLDLVYKNMMSQKNILAEALIQKMSQELRKVKHGEPNRWIEGNCWNFTADANQWNREWKNRYLSAALDALSQVSVGMDSILNRPRNSWLDRGINSFKEYLQAKEWRAFEISEEYKRLPVALTNHTNQRSTSTRSPSLSV